MCEYIHMFVGAAFFTTLFLGGWSLNPITGWDLPATGGILLIALQFGIVLAKVVFLVFLAMPHSLLRNCDTQRLGDWFNDSFFDFFQELSVKGHAQTQTQVNQFLLNLVQ